MSSVSNLVYLPGTIFVCPGGGGAPTPLEPGLTNQLLRINPAADLGVEWASAGNGDVAGPGSSTANNLAIFADTSGNLLDDAGYAVADLVLGAGTVADNTIPRFDGTTGGQLQPSLVVISNSDVMTFPAGAGVVLTAGGGAARKGTFTFTSGSSGDISTTSVATSSVIQVCITALGTVTAAQATYCAITNGSKFVIHSADATDTSSGTWAIVA